MTKRIALGLGVAVMLVAGIAQAAPDPAAQAVRALVTANVAAIAHDDLDAFEATLRPDAATLLPAGQGEMDTLAEQFYGRRVEHVTHKLGTLTLEVDASKHVAWFSAPVSASFAIQYDQGSKRGRRKLHVAGIAIDDGGWKIAALYWATALPTTSLEPDVKAAKLAAIPTTGLPAGKEIARWLGGGLAAHVAPGNAVIFGLDVTETGIGVKAATKLATAWDATALWPQALDVTQWGTFPIAFARGRVAVPDKAGAHYPAAIGMILVPDGAAWRWVVVGTTGDGDSE